MVFKWSVFLSTSLRSCNTVSYFTQYIFKKPTRLSLSAFMTTLAVNRYDPLCTYHCILAAQIKVNNIQCELLYIISVHEICKESSTSSSLYHWWRCSTPYNKVATGSGLNFCRFYIFPLVNMASVLHTSSLLRSFISLSSSRMSSFCFDISCWWTIVSIGLSWINFWSPSVSHGVFSSRAGNWMSSTIWTQSYILGNAWFLASAPLQVHCDVTSTLFTLN